NGTRDCSHHHGLCFNPHPALMPGATIFRQNKKTAPGRFQSSPGADAGCNFHLYKINPLTWKFQSSPGADAGCNEFVFKFQDGPWLFQSSPGADAGCNSIRANPW
ncbi:MAG: hypothetical protein ACOYEO_07570, partial [bacterium]